MLEHGPIGPTSLALSFFLCLPWVSIEDCLAPQLIPFSYVFSRFSNLSWQHFFYCSCQRAHRAGQCPHGGVPLLQDEVEPQSAVPAEGQQQRRKPEFWSERRKSYQGAPRDRVCTAERCSPWWADRMLRISFKMPVFYTCEECVLLKFVVVPVGRGVGTTSACCLATV